MTRSRTMVLATLATARSERLLDRGEKVAEALTAGYHLAFSIGAALVVAAIVVAVVVVRREPRSDEATGVNDAPCDRAAYAEA